MRLAHLIDDFSKILKHPLFRLLVAFWILSIIHVGSTSYVLGFEKVGDPYYFLKKQVFFLLITTFSTLLVFFLGFKSFLVLYILALFGLLMTFIPGLGAKVGGAYRWIILPLGLRWEPSEIFKVTFCMWFPALFYHQESFFRKMSSFLKVFSVIFPIGLLYFQPDFGSIVMICCLIFIFLWVNGVAIRALVFCGIPIAVSLLAAIIFVPYRLIRVLAFFDPWKDPLGSGYQVIQSMVAIAKGSFFGVGLGESSSKLFYLPEAHTDFTFSVFIEEWGLLGLGVLFYLFFLFGYQSYLIIAKFNNRFLKSASALLTSLFLLSVILNLAVVTGLVPTKGLTLPFLSYGGSSLLANSLLFAYLIKIDLSQQNECISS